jgi:hypothetical protein
MLLDAATVRRRGRFAGRPLGAIKHTRFTDDRRTAADERQGAIQRRL